MRGYILVKWRTKTEIKIIKSTPVIHFGMMYKHKCGGR